MYNRIKRIIHQMVKEDPGDIAHDVYIYLLEHPEHCPPTNWLIRYRAMDSLRKRKHMLELNDCPYQPQHILPMDRIDLLDVIKQAHLTEEENLLLYHTYILGHPIKQTARELSLSIKYTKGTIQNSLERMRRLTE